MKLKPTKATNILVLVCSLAWRSEAQTYNTNNVVVQTSAGSGFSGLQDGQGTLTMFNVPRGIVADSLSNLFVLDFNNHRIRKVSPTGTVTTFAGGGVNGTPGYGTNVSLNNLSHPIAIDHSNTLWLVEYIFSGTFTLVRITPDGYVTSTNLNVAYNSVGGLCVDSTNNLYFTDQAGNKIYRLQADGNLEVFAGSGNSGAADGNGIFTSFSSPTVLTADTADNIYVWDSGNRKVRRINQNRDVVTVTGGVAIDADGQNPSFNSVAAMCVDELGNLLLACNSSIRKMSAITNAVTLAGHFSQTGYTNGAGNLARFDEANGICLAGGVIYITDRSNQRIRSITFNASSQPVSPGNLQLNTYPGVQITGTIGRTYRIESTPDMTNWTTRATILLNSSPYLWVDQNPVSGNKFYRALLLP